MFPVSGRNIICVNKTPLYSLRSEVGESPAGGLWEEPHSDLLRLVWIQLKIPFSRVSFRNITSVVSAVQLGEKCLPQAGTARVSWASATARRGRRFRRSTSSTHTDQSKCSLPVRTPRPL